MWMPFLTLIVVLLAFWWPWQQGAAGNDQAMHIARRRLASGEINHEEFERLKQQLGVSRGWGGPSPALLIALLVGLLLIALASSMAWAWQSDDWGWGMMDGMMGRGDRSSVSTVRITDDAEVAVGIRDFAYEPSRLEIRAGARVTWTNEDSVPHSATARGDEWDTGLFGKGESRSRTFDRAGEFSYYCSIHPTMLASLLVRP